MNLRRMAGADDRRHEAFGRIQANPRRIGIIARRNERGAFRRCFEGFRDDDGDRLVGVADLVVLQEIEPEHEGICFFVRILRQRRSVGRRHHLDDARMGFRRVDVEKRDAAARDAAHRQDRVEHPGRMIVGGISGAARDFENAVTAGEWLTDVRAVANMSRRPA